MDSETLKVLLASQERAFRSSLDVAIEQMNAKARTAESNISEVIKSLEFSQADIRDLKNEVIVLRKSEHEKQLEIETLQNKVAELEQRLNYQEDYSRRNNLRITGFLEQGETTWEQTAANVSKLLENKLQLPSVKIERAHRVGNSSSNPRPVVVRFVSFSDRESVLRNARKLKGTGIFVNEDLCPASLEIKKKKIPLLKKAREEGKVAFFRHTRLIIREKTPQVPSSSESVSLVRPDEAASGSGAAGNSRDCPSSAASGDDSLSRKVNVAGGGVSSDDPPHIRKNGDVRKSGILDLSGSTDPVTSPSVTAGRITAVVDVSAEEHGSTGTRSRRASKKKT